MLSRRRFGAGTLSSRILGDAQSTSARRVRNRPVQQTFILDSGTDADVRWEAARSIAISCTTHCDGQSGEPTMLRFQLLHFFMRIYYVTLNTADEASQISRALLEQRLAVCTNWFPITCAYREEEKIVEEAEMVLIVKAHAEYRSAVEQVIGQHINYTNFFAEIAPEYVNDTWLQWLNNEVPAKSGDGLR